MDRFFVIEDPSIEELRVLKAINGLITNQAEIPPGKELPLEKVNAAVTDPEYADGWSADALPWLGKWKSAERPMEELPKLGSIDLVIASGFFL
jgi:hypothetical protein